jgi:hypothetical protein
MKTMMLKLKKELPGDLLVMALGFLAGYVFKLMF